MERTVIGIRITKTKISLSKLVLDGDNTRVIDTTLIDSNATVLSSYFRENVSDASLIVVESLHAYEKVIAFVVSGATFHGVPVLTVTPSRVSSGLLTDADANPTNTITTVLAVPGFQYSVGNDDVLTAVLKLLSVATALYGIAFYKGEYHEEDV